MECDFAHCCDEYCSHLLLYSTDVSEADQADTPTGSTTPTPLTDDEKVKSKVDSRAEVSRLFRQLKQGSQDAQTKPPAVTPAAVATPIVVAPAPKKAEKKPWKKPLFAPTRFRGLWTPEAPAEEAVVSMCRGVVEEMEVGAKLLQFCWKLDVFVKLFGGAGNGFLPQVAESASSSSSKGSGVEEGQGGGAGDGETGVAAIIKK